MHKKPYLLLTRKEKASWNGHYLLAQSTLSFAFCAYYYQIWRQARFDGTPCHLQCLSTMLQSVMSHKVAVTLFQMYGCKLCHLPTSHWGAQLGLLGKVMRRCVCVFPSDMWCLWKAPESTKFVWLFYIRHHCKIDTLFTQCYILWWIPCVLKHFRLHNISLGSRAGSS